jgi:hypothetical protein
MICTVDTKLCVACKEEVKLSLFSINRASKDGLQVRCKSCDNFRQAIRRMFNKEITNAKSKEYQKNRRKDPDYRLKMLLSAAKQRSINKNREFNITVDDIKYLWPSNNKCPVFGFELVWNNAGFRDTSPSIDRIDSSKGYTRDNIQIISWKANSIKSSSTVEDLRTVLKYMEQGAHFV